MSFEQLEEKEAVKRAALIEENGHAFYTLLSEKTESQGAREVFKKLARDEKRHLKVLEKHFFPEAGLHEQVTEEEIVIEEYVKVHDAPEVFSRKIDVERLVGSIDSLRTALMVALAAERHSVDFFVAMARRAETVDGRKMYDWLADEERRHVRQIEELMDGA